MRQNLGNRDGKLCGSEARRYFLPRDRKTFVTRVDSRVRTYTPTRLYVYTRQTYNSNESACACTRRRTLLEVVARD